jgi:G:T-mismatch repair DNA endonuclease (very short patch repair protein)
VTRENGIPVTTVPRTILDLAATLPERAVERCVNEAEIRRLWDPLSLPDLIARYPGRAGTPAVRAILGRRSDGAVFTRRELEFRFLRFVADAGLPPPAVNQPLWVRNILFEVDCLWRRERVIVELDSRTYHHTDLAFERDRRRHRMLEAAGWRTAQVTWRQLHDEPAELEADLRRLLSAPVED